MLGFGCLCEEGGACSDEAIQDVDVSLLKSTSWIASLEQAPPSSQRRAKAQHPQPPANPQLY